MRTLAAALLLCASGLAAAAETLALALDDLDRHGYASPRLAIERLQAVTDRPDVNAPVEQQLRYHATLAQLAVHGRHKAQLDTALAALQRLADGGRCAPCGPRLLAVRIAHADMHDQDELVKGLMDQLAALPPSSDLRFEAERLDMLSGARVRHEQYDAALSLGLRAVETAERAGLPALEARMLHALVRVHLPRGDLASALRVADECYALAERIGFRYAMAQARINQNYLYGTLEQEKKSHEALLDVLRITQGVPGTEDLQQLAQGNLSAYHIHRGEYPQAIAATQAAEQLARQTGDELGLAFAISNRGSALARSGRVDEGMALMRSAMTKAEQVGGRREVLDLLAEQVNVLEHAGRDREALAVLRRVVKLSGDITSAEREKAVLALQEQFSTERKTREIERLSLAHARAEAEQRQWIAVAVALLLSTALLVQWLRMTRRRNQALVVDNAALTSQSIHDPLTGAFNRRHFEQFMKRQDAGIGLVLLDIDHFKQINDTHGHLAGDEVLKAVAERLRGVVREQDAVVRWGGEEFVLALPGTSAEGLAVVAAKALSELGHAPVVCNGVAIPVRASAGAIAWPAWPAQDWAEALRVADALLYMSKTGGRNRATCCMGVRPGADVGRVNGDPASAAAAGDIELRVVSGPA
ncbi:diguanylate cyclase [Massilia sp. Leaf139]|uniref:diguanylate cyclase n=1 Tax=Massilia sp. Leaf139 TaxID=1736272 RepID=UPI0006F8509D|nr:diguanylate cyclase [Massilia sp. Leaf139]KQQ88568.1 hypothetical protein ASF77_13010 [Massilia sp. Leaf139]